MSRRLFWVGVGVGLTVLAMRQGRRWYATTVPRPAQDAVGAAVAVGTGARHALAEFRAGRDAKAAELTAALVGDRDVDALRAARDEHVRSLRRTVGGEPAAPTRRPQDRPADRDATA